ncbi:MAG: arylesterase, partial [Comamonadaceae bacterium]
RRSTSTSEPSDGASAESRAGKITFTRPEEIVMLSIGGNDFLRRVPVATTRANIRSICEQAVAAGAQVLLVAVPAFSLAAAVGSLSDHALYAELARELKLPLHAGGWSTVLADPALRSDAIHGNAQGYARFAQGLAQAARDSGMR